MNPTANRPGTATLADTPGAWLSSWTGQVSKARARTAQLRDVRQTASPDDRTVTTIHELQLTYEELSVAEEELRSQNAQLEEAAAALDAERDRYQKLFDEAPVPYLVTDDSGTIRDANIAAGRLTRCPIEFLAGKPIVVFTRHDSRRTIRDMLRRLRGGDATTEARLEITTRRSLVVRVNATAHASVDPVRGTREIRWMFADERPRRRRERIVRERAAALEALVAERTAELEHAHFVKDQLIATVSHELRTPLTAIAGFTELLSLGVHGALSSAQQADLRRIQRAYEHMTRVVEDLLSYHGIAAGTLSLDIQDVLLADQLRAVVELIASPASERGLTLSVEDGIGSRFIRADADRLRQVLLNLIGNAVKYTPAGGAIRVRASSAPAHAIIEVEDTGPGIPRKDQAIIFEPFNRLARDRTTPGIGLGLTISRELARGMGGDITVVSEENVGTCFSLQLPFSTRLARTET